MLSRNYFGMCLALLSFGCSSTNTSSTTPEAQTLIGVDPKDFMGTGVCGTKIQRYVATLTDVTGPDGSIASGTEGIAWRPFLVGSSPPTPCTAELAFGRAVAYHAYEATLDGYDRADIEPLASESSAMGVEGVYIPPLYTATCHGWTDSDGGVEPGTSYPNVTVMLRNCTKLGQ